jgi:hypothetical protein
MDLITPNITKPRVDVQFKTAVSEERQTIVHVTCTDLIFGMMLIRIWPSTFLIQNDGKRKKLLQSFNIGKHPFYITVPDGHVFTLLFEGLDRGCDTFDLLEDITEPGGFYIKGIERNNTDIYHLEINATE